MGRRRAVAFEPAGGGGGVVSVGGLGEEEPAQGEGAFGGAERAVVGAVAVDVAVVGELGGDRAQGGGVAGVVGGQCAVEGGEQESGVDAGVVGGALPAAAGVQAVGGVGQNGVGEGVPVGRVGSVAVRGGEGA